MPRPARGTGRAPPRFPQRAATRAHRTAAERSGTHPRPAPRRRRSVRRPTTATDETFMTSGGGSIANLTMWFAVSVADGFDEQAPCGQRAGNRRDRNRDAGQKPRGSRSCRAAPDLMCGFLAFHVGDDQPCVSRIVQPVRGFSLEAAPQQAPQVVRRLGWQSRPVDLLAQHGRERVRDRFAFERPLAGQHLVDHDTEAPRCRRACPPPCPAPVPGPCRPRYRESFQTL